MGLARDADDYGPLLDSLLCILDLEDSALRRAAAGQRLIVI